MNKEKKNLTIDENEFVQLVESYVKKRNESWKLRLELSNLKAEIVNHKLLSSENDVEELDFNIGKLFITRSKTLYSKFLNKDFRNLSNEEKRKLYKTGLIKLLFRLDQKKFQDLKNKNIKTLMDKYVIESKDNNPYEIKLEYSDKIKDEINSLKSSLVKVLTQKEIDKILSYLDELDQERQQIDQEYQQILDDQSDNSLEDFFNEDDELDEDVRKQYD